MLRRLLSCWLCLGLLACREEDPKSQGDGIDSADGAVHGAGEYARPLGRACEPEPRARPTGTACEAPRSLRGCSVIAERVQARGELHVVDFNDDRRADLLERSTASDQWTVHLGTSGPLIDACLHSSGVPVLDAELSFGDLNEDGLPDALLGGCGRLDCALPDHFVYFLNRGKGQVLPTREYLVDGGFHRKPVALNLLDDGASSPRACS